MDATFSYFIVISIVAILGWQAYSHLNRGSRVPRSLINSIKIDDFEVSDYDPSNTSSGTTIIAPRIEYAAENQPFPQSYIDNNITATINLLEISIENYWPVMVQ